MLSTNDFRFSVLRSVIRNVRPNHLAQHSEGALRIVDRVHFMSHIPPYHRSPNQCGVAQVQLRIQILLNVCWYRCRQEDLPQAHIRESLHLGQILPPGRVLNRHMGFVKHYHIQLPMLLDMFCVPHKCWRE